MKREAAEHCNANMTPTQKENRKRQFRESQERKMNYPCSYCGALKWIDERCAASSKCTPIFSICCTHGKVLLPPLQEPPALLKELLTNNDPCSQEFKQNIRAYNSALAFTSVGAKIDENVTGTQDTYTYHIHGEIYYRIGLLLPQFLTSLPLFAQIYIYDTDNE
ncbi:13077_t:CDS:2, partial [Cetraspora pellucida]